jgi:hypothetical protein
MIKALEELIQQTEAHLPELERERFSSGFANDVFESIDYWRNLGRYAMEKNTRVNYPQIARGQLEFLGELQRVLQNRARQEQQKYAPLLATCHRILLLLEQVQPPKDGHLGVWRVIRKHFQFMQTDYKFSIVDMQPTGVRFSSGAVYLKLECIYGLTLSCSFGPETEPRDSFWINDLLYMNGDARYRNLPEELHLDTEEEVENWFTFLADVFKRYGHPVLSNEPSIFSRLTQAQAERDAEYVREMNRNFGVEGKG